MVRRLRRAWSNGSPAGANLEGAEAPLGVEDAGFGIGPGDAGSRGLAVEVTLRP
jgi:hypothetical protein